MSKKICVVLFCLVFIFFPCSAFAADDKAEQLLNAVAAATKNSKALTGDYEIRRRHLDPFEEIREEGKFQLLRPNFFSIEGVNLLPSNTTGKWEKVSDAPAYTSNGNIFYTLFKNSEGVSYQQARADLSGKNISVNLQPFADFFDESNSFFNQIVEARRKKTLTSLRYISEKSWENSLYDVVEFVADDAEKGIARHRIVQLYIGGDKRIHRLIDTQKWGDLHTETETILRKVSAKAPLKPANFKYTLPVGAKSYVPPPSPLAKGTQIPDLTLVDGSGKLIKLADFRGKTVILDFWATWCVPCLKSFPHTAAVVKKLNNKEIIVLAVNTWDSPQNAVGWLSKHPEFNSFLFVSDAAGANIESSTKLFQVGTLPLQYVISPNGKIVADFQGFIGPTSELEEAIKAANNF